LGKYQHLGKTVIPNFTAKTIQGVLISP